MSSKDTLGHWASTITVSSWTRARQQGDSLRAATRQSRARSDDAFAEQQLHIRALRKCRKKKRELCAKKNANQSSLNTERLFMMKLKLNGQKKIIFINKEPVQRT